MIKCSKHITKVFEILLRNLTDRFLMICFYCRLAFFERKYQFFSASQFADAVVYHYAGQAVKQLYVLVFGLDVIGNPYGLVMGRLNFFKLLCDEKCHYSWLVNIVLVSS